VLAAGELHGNLEAVAVEIVPVLTCGQHLSASSTALLGGGGAAAADLHAAGNVVPVCPVGDAVLEDFIGVILARRLEPHAQVGRSRSTDRGRMAVETRDGAGWRGLIGVRSSAETLLLAIKPWFWL
jgi:hypothetical protein